MFDSLSTRVQEVFKSLRGEVRLTEDHVEAALREIRLALLEADVNFKVVKAFIDRVRDRAMDQTVLRSLTPGQHVIKIVRDELLALFGDAEGGLTKTATTPRVVLLLGLQGSGKTTTAGKLGKWLVRQGRHPLMVSTDVRRPAAIEQLSVLGEKAEIRVYAPETMDPIMRATGALTEARAKGFDTVIVDTAGRLHIDDELMDELQAIKDAVHPADLLYVADAMTGQDAIKSAGEFNRRVEFEHRRRGTPDRARLVRLQCRWPMNDPHVIVRIDGHTRHSAKNPAIGQRLRPLRVDLVRRHVPRALCSRNCGRTATGHHCEPEDCGNRPAGTS